MEDAIVPIVAFFTLFIALPWIVLHYMSQWRRAKGISIEDENLLDDLHDTARQLDSRLDSIERIIAADNPGWRDSALGSATPANRITDQADAPRHAFRR